MIIQALVDILKGHAPLEALVADRIYPLEAPDAPTYPYVIVHKGTGVGIYDTGGDAGLEDARVQVDVFSAAGYANVLAIKQVIRRFLSGFKGGGETGGPCVIDACTCINDFDLTETATERAGPRIRRRVLEFRIWNMEV